jgi:hypothetical protein
MVNDFRDLPYASSLIYYSERFTQRYFESQSQEIDISSANLIYATLTIS